MPVATSPNITDICAFCGHSRDRHGPDSRCRVYERDVPVGGNDGVDLDKESPTYGEMIVLPGVVEEYQDNGGGIIASHYHREACFCPGAEVYHIVGLPVGYQWDTIEGTTWRPSPGFRLDEYQWWKIEKK